MMDATKSRLQNYAYLIFSLSLFLVLLNSDNYLLNLLGWLILVLCILCNFINFVKLFVGETLISPIEKAVIVTGIYVIYYNY